MANLSADVTFVHRQVRIPGPLLAEDSMERIQEPRQAQELLWPTPTNSALHALSRRGKPNRPFLAFGFKEHLVFAPKEADEGEPNPGQSPLRRANSLRRWRKPNVAASVESYSSSPSANPGLFIGRPVDISQSLTPTKSRERAPNDLPVMDYYKRLSTRPEQGVRTPNTYQRKAASKGGYRTKLQKDPVISRSALGLYEYVDCYQKDSLFLKRTAIKLRRKPGTRVARAAMD